MPFFARPDLSNEQFKQLIGSTLTLSGQTQFANVTGLTVIDETGVYIPIIVTGATDGRVLTYDSTLSQIIMKDPSSVGAFIYSGASPSTCTVGGLSAGTTIYGCQITCILQDILVPLLPPTLSSPFSVFTISPATTIYEVGASISVTGYTTFNRGCICPAYSTSGFRTGVPISYIYTKFDGLQTVCTSSGLTNSYALPSYSITQGNNNASAIVCYNAGEQPLKSDCSTPYLSGCTTGTTNSTCPGAVITRTVSGIYPYYYGKVTCACPAGVGRPSASCIKTVITGGTGTCTKCVCLSNSTICVQFCSNADDYLWFAVPSGATSAKTKWYVDALNNGSIGGAVSAGGNLFPAYDLVTNVKSNSGYWSGQTYQIYVSNYQTCTKCCGGSCCFTMELRNS